MRDRATFARGGFHGWPASQHSLKEGKDYRERERVGMQTERLGEQVESGRDGERQRKS